LPPKSVREDVPELPEVEIVRRGLEPALVGHRFAGVEVRRPDLRSPFPDRFAVRLKGEKVRSLGRRAKYLIAHLSSDEVLVMHLGMSGRFTVRPAGKKTALELGEFTYDQGGDAAHDHVVFTMESGAVITYNDPRRFGLMTLVPAQDLEAHELFRGLGVEPLGNALNADYLAGKARGRTADLKAFLMDQRIVAGLGNIYVCEALWRAHLSPNRRAGSLARKAGRKGIAPTERAELLVPAIRSVLEQAIGAGGSTLRDYRNADGGIGAFQHAFSVYGREGGPCLTPGCPGIVRRTVQGGRSTFYCGVCQR
jgi:formamidopyrimidine-DNA glycosylase